MWPLLRRTYFHAGMRMLQHTQKKQNIYQTMPALCHQGGNTSSPENLLCTNPADNPWDIFKWHVQQLHANRMQQTIGRISPSNSCPAMQRICSQGFCTHLKKKGRTLMPGAGGVVRNALQNPHHEHHWNGVCVCVGNPESKGKSRGPWTHRWHGPTKTHLCRRENVPAKLSSSEMARWPSQKPPMPTCHAMTWHANVTTWHDGYHFISFHPLQIQGVYQSVSFMHPDLW